MMQDEERNVSNNCVHSPITENTQLCFKLGSLELKTIVPDEQM